MSDTNTLKEKLGLKDFVLRGLQARDCQGLIEEYHIMNQNLQQVTESTALKLFQQNGEFLKDLQKGANKDVLEDVKRLETDLENNPEDETLKNHIAEKKETFEYKLIELTERSEQIQELKEKVKNSIADTDEAKEAKKKAEEDLTELERQEQLSLFQLIALKPELVGMMPGFDEELEAKKRTMRKELRRIYKELLESIMEGFKIPQEKQNDLSNEEFEALVYAVTSEPKNRTGDFFTTVGGTEVA